MISVCTCYTDILYAWTYNNAASGVAAQARGALAVEPRLILYLRVVVVVAAMATVAVDVVAVVSAGCFGVALSI